MDANVPPLIIPMWLTGFDKLMPQGRPSPYKYFPKPGIKLGVAFGDPIPSERIFALLDVLRHDASTQKHSSINTPAVGEELQLRTAEITSEEYPRQHAMHKTQVNRTRSEVTAVIQCAVEDLGRKISGDKLDGPLID